MSADILAFIRLVAYFAEVEVYSVAYNLGVKPDWVESYKIYGNCIF